ncbi:MAG: hypothetical protein RJA44_664 [Pseudomonadota bacterium]
MSAELLPLFPPLDPCDAAGVPDRALRGLDMLRGPVWVFDIDHSRVLWANRAGLDMWQADSLDELRARDLGGDMSPAVRRRLLQYQDDFRRTDARFTEIWTLYPHDEPVHLDVDFSGVRLQDGSIAMWCEARHKSFSDPVALRSTEALLHTEVMITLYGPEGAALYRNPAARDAATRGAQCHPERFVDPADYQALVEQMTAQRQGRIVARVHTAEGERWHDITARSSRDAVTGQPAWLISEVDVTELKQAEARAQFLAEHDPLTGLPNRHFLARGFAGELARLARSGSPAALVFIDLDQFKDINDSLGHGVGDELLIELSKRLLDSVNAPDLVARLGGDEFILLMHLPAGPVLEARVARLTELLSRPVRLRHHEVRVTPSIGISLYPQDGTELDTLMRQADLAMYDAKASGRNRHCYFRPELRTVALARLELEQDLRQALAAGNELQVYYQPRLAVQGGQVVGAEALLRWQHPRRGMIGPGEFIGLAEDCGLIAPLGLWVLEQAAQQLARWQAEGLQLTVSVNLSPRQLSDPALVEQLAAILATTGCRPAQLELEITESVLLGHDERTLGVLHQLRALGLRIAVDDFGTGYSNLAYLQRYPIQCLKIDRAFVAALDTAAPIAELIITLCRMLQLQVVAEGVETPEQLAWLAERNCHEFQGFLFSPPLPLERFERLLAQAAAGELSSAPAAARATAALPG